MGGEDGSFSDIQYRAKAIVWKWQTHCSRQAAA
jgi:hypothetical protein